MNKTDSDKLAESIIKHRMSQEISIEAHVKMRALELNASISGIKRIYLDKCFWILLRDVHMGRSKSSLLANLLDTLNRGVKNGKILCPISESIFLELLKQQDLCTRRSTAELIDELSKGVALVPYKQRIAQELVGVFCKFSQDDLEYYDAQDLIWTKLSYVLGVVHPTSTVFEANEELAIQKALFDHIWQIHLVELIGELECNYKSIEESFQSTADHINELNRIHNSEIRNFKQLYVDEFRGVLSLFMHIPRLWLKNEYERRTGNPHMTTEQENHEHERQLLTFFGNLIKKKRAALMLPTLHISSLCHAAIRWDKMRKISRNDFYDFRHAGAAVGYCDALLTEKPLMTMLKQKHLELEKDFSCQIISNVDEANDWVSEVVCG